MQPIDATNIIADVCWLVDSELKVGDNLIVRHPSGEAHGKVTRILHRLDLDTLRNSSTDTLVLNDIARVVIQLKTPLVVDAYISNRAGGSAIAIDPVTNATIGALMVVGQEGAQSVAPKKSASSKKGVRGLVKEFFTLKVNEEF